MSKKKPQRRALVGSAVPDRHTIQPFVACMACNMRSMSNKALRENASDGNIDAKTYSGFLAGYANRAIPIAQFHNGKQVGFIAVPLVGVDSFIANISDRAQAALKELLDASSADATTEEDLVRDRVGGQERELLPDDGSDSEGAEPDYGEDDDE